MSRRTRRLLLSVLAPALLAACSDSSPARDAGPIVWDYQRCPLDLALVNASHVVGVDSASGEVTSVEHVRTTDPRADVFAKHPIGPGVPVKFTRSDQVPGFADAGPGAVALVGQKRTDLPDEWTVFAVGNVSQKAVTFVGPCANEFNKQYAKIAKVFEGGTDIDLLDRMIDEALLPGRGADLQNVAAPATLSAKVVTDSIAARWKDKVRVVSFVVTFNQPRLGGIAGLVSDVGYYGVGVGADVGTTTVDTLAVVPLEGPLQLVMQDVNTQAFVGTPLDLTGSECRDATDMYVHVDVVAHTAKCTVGNSTPQDVIDNAQAALVFNTTAAIPEFAPGPPPQY